MYDLNNYDVINIIYDFIINYFFTKCLIVRKYLIYFVRSQAFCLYRLEKRVPGIESANHQLCIIKEKRIITVLCAKLYNLFYHSAHN